MGENTKKRVKFELNGEMKKFISGCLNSNHKVSYIVKNLKDSFDLSYSDSTIRQCVNAFKKNYNEPLFEAFENSSSQDTRKTNYDEPYISSVYTDHIYTIIDSIEVLSKNIKALNKELEEIKMAINKTEDTNQRSITQDCSSNFIDNYIAIYNSKKEKKSYSINSEIKDLAVKKIHDRYNLKTYNESHAIEIALLESLYDYKSKEPQG